MTSRGGVAPQIQSRCRVAVEGRDTYELCLYCGYGAICTKRRTVEKPYPVNRASDNVGLRVLNPLVIPRAGYHHREDGDKKRRITKFTGHQLIFFSSTLLLLLQPHDSRDSVTALMKTSSPTEHILDIPGSTITQLCSVSTPKGPAMQRGGCPR
ncbi:hypothetical protein PIB30_059971 [Stylosanthes scabra]|uniref:Uncharacterized protein n=1 Tax=Stylosanthes scabra TaxID=79078 RepID=A0ABU6XJE7_9FABA|nr:hypothetical protein [Stylosanthes scabra]